VHVSAWQAGNDEAGELLCARFSSLLERRIRKNRAWPLVERLQPIEDVVNDIWVRALAPARERFEPSGTGSFLAFLGKIADHTVVDLARRFTASKRGGGGHVQALDDTTEKEATRLPSRPRVETPTSYARASELRELPDRVLNQRELEAWELRVFEDREYVEIALALDCTEAAARSLHLRARSKLMKHLALESDSPND
jgi:RNA polymerase sigma factor (sigma-70 family)